MKSTKANKNILSVIKNKIFSIDRRFIVISLVVVIVLSVATYAAINVNNFGGGYSPPSFLNIRWGDYYTNSSKNVLNITNASTSYPRWTADYPYRAVFIGMGRDGSSYNPPNTCISYLYVVYSKKPVSDLFTFEYIDGSRNNSSNKRGYIRASFDSSKYNVYDNGIPSSDIWIMHGGFGFPNWVDPVIVSDMLNHVGYPLFVSGNKHYFEFDFYYECAGEHQQNAYPLNISGLRSVANVPYGYILKCEEHAPPGGSASGGESSGGGGESSGGSGGNNPGGGHGSPSTGGGNRDGTSYPSTRPGEENDMIGNPEDRELSVPDDWKTGDWNSYDEFDESKIPELDWDIEPEPYDIVGEGDTGERGDTWELPEWTVKPELPFTDDDLNMPDFPFEGQFTNEGFAPDFEEDNYSWPPPFPLYPESEG